MIDRRIVGMYESNCYLYACSETKKGVVIDPGAYGKEIHRWLSETGIKIEYILLTHGHVDHIGGVDELKDLLDGVKVGIHAGDADMLVSAKKNQSLLVGFNLVQKAADIMLEDGQVIEVGKQKLKVISTPGHSPGSVCFLTSEGLFSGDTLFEGSIGRTDFPGGSLPQLLSGVKEKILIMPDETPVFPGHGGATTVGQEKLYNPFLKYPY